MSVTRLLFCCVLSVGSVARCCAADDDPVERLLLSIEQNRSARMFFDYDFRRDSPLLDRPLTAAYQIESEIHDSVGRVVKLRRVPDNRVEALQVQVGGERPATGDGISLRTETVRRQGQLLRVNAPVSSNQPTILNPGARISLILTDPALSTNGLDKRSQLEPKRNLLRNALYNFALGVVLQNPIENYVGQASDRVRKETAGEVEYISETRFGKCTLHWSNPEAVYPDRLTMQLSGDDILVDKPLSDVSFNGGKGWPAGGVRSVTAEVSDIRISEYGTNVVPVAWTSINSYECADGSTIVETCKIRLSDVEFGTNESSADKVQVAVPIRHRVSVEGARQLQYIWDGDWAVSSAGS